MLHLDDDELQLDILKINLEQMNHDIIVDSEIDGLKALEKIKTNGYDCILLDYLMPIYDGIEIADRIRKFSNVPIILYTVQGSEDLAERLFSVGITDYLRKEINVSNYSVLENKIIDITNKYRIEKIFNEVIKSIDDSIIIVDGKYEIIYHNDIFIDLVEKVDLIGKSIIEVIEKESKNKRYHRYYSTK